MNLQELLGIPKTDLSSLLGVQKNQNSLATLLGAESETVINP
jgi:hypothetical protein